MNIENPFKEAEERLIFAKVLDKYTAAVKKRVTTHTDFLDPVRCAAFMQVLQRHGSREITIEAFGGYDGAERKVIVFMHSENPTGRNFRPVEFENDKTVDNFGTSRTPSPTNAPITPLTITYNEKFSKAPTHRDYLGSVIGLGLDRGKLGDICITQGGAVMYVLAEVAHFIAENLTQAGRTRLNITLGQELGGIEATGKQKRITVASMRLDAVLSSALNLSRGKVSALIESEKVFVNWKLARKTHTVQVGDAITVRGVGRVTVDAQGGHSKKDRIVLEVTV